MQALLFEFVKVGKHCIDKRLGNKVNFELNMITASSTELINCLKLALKWTPKKRHVVPFNLLNKILCPEKNSISLTEVFHQAELKWNGLPESTLTYHSNSLWKASSGNCSYWNLSQAGGNCSYWSMLCFHLLLNLLHPCIT